MRRIACLLALFAASLTAAQNLEIYFIDVEGGKSVLLVSPSGQSMLFDAGWPATNNRLASNERIVEAVEAAGLRRIDFLVISHFDLDHLGDVPLLAAKVPIEHIFDHGEYLTTNPQAAARFAAYAALRDKIGHTVLHVGDKIPIRGVNVRVLAAGGQLIKKPLAGAGARNTLCDTYKQQDVLATDFEDNQSIGLLITEGKFRMLDLADLEAHYSHDLVCPRNLIGAVDVYNVNVHGQFKGIAPEVVGALHAPVIVQANGARKGADAQSWPVLRAAPGLQDIWQLHYSLNAGKEENPPDNFIANLEGSDAFKWIHLSVAKNGTFTVINTRNGFSKRYGK
ncbi:MAG: MBL fold metallo-hydrolase [Acidobacteriota bacterium]